MTGGGAPGAPGIIHCISQNPAIGLIIADANKNAVGRYLGHTFRTIPKADDPLFIPTVLELCKTEDVQLILPLVTRELVPLSAAREEFKKNNIEVLVSDIAGLEIANNKSRLYEFLQWRGVAVPEFRIVETVKQFEESISLLGYPSKPVCFKPSVSNGSRGFRIIDESKNESDLLFNHKPSSVYITYKEAIRLLSSTTFPELLVSEYLPGDEYSVDCLANNGEARVILPRIRNKMINGISVEGEFIKNDMIIEYCRQIISHLKLHGNIGIQVKGSSKDEFLILEINPRVQGSISAALGAGVNLPLLAIDQQSGKTIDSENMHIRWGTKFTRYWTEVFY